MRNDPRTRLSSGVRRRRGARAAGTLAAWIVIAVGFASAPARGEGPVVRLAINGPVRFEHAGYVAAIEQGFFADEGLDVRLVGLRDGEPDVRIVDMVLSGEATHGVAGSPLLVRRLRGDPVVIVTPVFQHTSYGLLTRPGASLSTPPQLADKRVLVQEGDGDAEALVMLRQVSRAGVAQADSDEAVDALVAGKADAIAANLCAVYPALRARGIEPTLLIPVHHGASFYGDCVFTSKANHDAAPDVSRRLRRATLRGWRHALANTEATVQTILSRYDAESRGQTRDMLLYEAGLLRPLVAPDLVPLGTSNPPRWERSAASLVEVGLVPPDSPARLDGFVLELDRGRGDGRLVRGLLWTLAGGGALALAVLAWNMHLRREVRRRTDELEAGNVALRAEAARRTIAEARASERHARLEILHALSTWMNEGEAYDDIASRTTRDLVALFPGLRAACWTIDDSGLARPLAFAGWADDGPGEEVIDRSRLREREVFESPSPPAGLARIESPVCFGSDLVGRVTLDAPAPHAWSEHELRTLREVAAYLGAAGRAWEFEQERRAVVEKVVRSGDQYRLLFESNPLPMWVYDTRTLRFLAVNDAAIRKYGYDRAEWAQMTLEDIRPAEERARVREAARAAQSQGLASHGVWRHLTKQGRPLDVEVLSQPARFIAETARLSVALDMTAVRQAERALRDLRDAAQRRYAELHALYECAPVALAHFDADLRLLRLNHAFAAAVGVHEIDAFRRPLAPGGAGDALAAPLREAARAGRPLENVELSWRPGQAWLGTFYPLRLPPGEPGVPEGVGVGVVLVDVSEARAALAALRHAEQRLDLALSAASDGVWERDFRTGEAFWSARYCSMLGLGERARRFAFAEFDTRLHPDDRAAVAAAMEAHLRRREPYDVEYRLRHESGEYRRFRSRGQAVWDESGRPVFMAGAVQEVREGPVPARATDEPGK